MSIDLASQYRIPLATRIRLADQSTRETQGWEKEQAKKRTTENIAKIDELQYRLFVEQKRALLIVLQAPDAAGKDGLIRRVLGQMNPQGTRVHSFKVPTEIERAHDFLWRIHANAPAKGEVAIFNRSHYEDVLVVRVHQLVPEAIWQRRFEHINAFERMLSDAGTEIVKIMLHISPREQLERFKERLEMPEKHWKLSEGDYRERDLWPKYEAAFEDAIALCNAEHAPWYIVPSDRNWFRDLVVSEIVLATLQRIDPQLPPVTADLKAIKKLLEREEREQKD
jgi:PPK2 family polyphosphate:nucleotide phosphotransferase